MLFDNIYKNTVTFTTNNNVEFRFTDNASEMRYLLDIVIDNNIVINNVLSIGSLKNIGSIVNNSIPIGINLDSSKIILILSGAHTIDIKIKQGIFIGISNSVGTPGSYYVISSGYSFGLGNLLMTEVDKTSYISSLSGVEDTVLSDVNSLLHSSEEMTKEDLYTPYTHNNITYPKFAYISKIDSDNIATYFAEQSIPNTVFTNYGIGENKINSDATVSLDRADSSVRDVYLNGNPIPEIKSNGIINLNLTESIKFLKEGITEYYSYNTDLGIATINHASSDLQPKILNTNTDAKEYFISYKTEGGYDFKDMEDFFKKANTINEEETVSSALLYSTLKTQTLLNEKVNTLQQQNTPVDNKFVKAKINDQGLVYESQEVSQTNLTNELGHYYQKTGTKKVINTPRSTIFFM